MEKATPFYPCADTSWRNLLSLQDPHIPLFPSDQDAFLCFETRKIPAISSYPSTLQESLLCHALHAATHQQFGPTGFHTPRRESKGTVIGLLDVVGLFHISKFLSLHHQLVCYMDFSAGHILTTAVLPDTMSHPSCQSSCSSTSCSSNTQHSWTLPFTLFLPLASFLNRE